MSTDGDTSPGAQTGSLVEPKVLLFIVGTGRCGSTLLQSMLIVHPEVVIPPETHFFFRFDPVLRFADPLPREQFDAYVQHVISIKQFQWLGLEEPSLREFLRGRESVTGGELYLWLMTSVTGRGGGGGGGDSCDQPRVVGEKSPKHAADMARILDLFPEAKFIHIYRDPRDVVVSMHRTPWWGDQGAVRTSRYCRRVLGGQLEWAQKLTEDQYLAMRYETLVEEPRQEMERACAFLGIEFLEAMLEHQKHQGGATKYVPEEASWKSLSDQPLVRSRIGRYRESLSPREIRAIERIVGAKIFAALGYAPDDEVGSRLYWPVVDALEERWSRIRKELVRGLRRLPGVAPARPGASDTG